MLVKHKSWPIVSCKSRWLIWCLPVFRETFLIVLASLVERIARVEASWKIVDVTAKIFSRMCCGPLAGVLLIVKRWAFPRNDMRATSAKPFLYSGSRRIVRSGMWDAPKWTVTGRTCHMNGFGSGVKKVTLARKNSRRVKWGATFEVRFGRTSLRS